MNDFLKSLAEILDEPDVTPQSVLSEYVSWDSLAVLSVLSLAQDTYGVTIDGPMVREATTVEDLYNRIQDLKNK